MRQLIDRGEAATPSAAAMLILKRDPTAVAGAGTIDSKITRLVKRLRAGE
jgi:hypothetical protein